MRYEISITISEIDENGEVNVDEYVGEINCQLETDEPPVTTLLEALQNIEGVSELST